jgi:hypothetical protein
MSDGFEPFETISLWGILEKARGINYYGEK